jgi:hypothetical protein
VKKGHLNRPYPPSEESSMLISAETKKSPFNNKVTKKFTLLLKFKEAVYLIN